MDGLQRLKKLETLALIRSAISPENHFDIPLQQLLNLSIDQPDLKIDAECLLRCYPSIGRLHLHRCQVDDSQVERFAQATQLRRLSISAGTITRAGVARAVATNERLAIYAFGESRPFTHPDWKPEYLNLE